MKNTIDRGKLPALNCTDYMYASVTACFKIWLDFFPVVTNTIKEKKRMVYHQHIYTKKRLLKNLKLNTNGVTHAVPVLRRGHDLQPLQNEN